MMSNYCPPSGLVIPDVFAPFTQSDESWSSGKEMPPNVVCEMRTDWREKMQLDSDEPENEILAHARVSRQTHLAVFVPGQLELEEPGPGGKNKEKTAPFYCVL